MKFKEINSSADINKVIAPSTKVDAPLDEKNITTDWISEDFFDECAQGGKNQYCGFINKTCVYIRTSGNCMMIQPMFGITSQTDADILHKLSEIFNVNVGGDVDRDSEIIALCETDKRRGYYFIRFYFGRYIGK